MFYAYTEDQLVEQPAIGLFAELGWTTVSALEEIFGCAETSPQPSPSGRGNTARSLGRETMGEVVLVSRLRAAFERLNPALCPPRPCGGFFPPLRHVGEESLAVLIG